QFDSRPHDFCDCPPAFHDSPGRQDHGTRRGADRGGRQSSRSPRPRRAISAPLRDAICGERARSGDLLRVAMLKSMTGYAEATLQERDWTLRLAIRSLNHRFLDLHIRLPVELEFCEPVMRQGLRDKICRGHLDVSAQISRKDMASVQVNRDALTGYVSLVRELRREYSFDSSPNPAELLRLPGVLASE